MIFNEFKSFINENSFLNNIFKKNIFPVVVPENIETISKEIIVIECSNLDTIENSIIENLLLIYTYKLIIFSDSYFFINDNLENILKELKKFKGVFNNKKIYPFNLINYQEKYISEISKYISEITIELKVQY